jgi:hypothetical protein
MLRAAEPLPDGAGVVPVVGQLEAAGVAQHVRVHRQRQPRRTADPVDELLQAGDGHRPGALGGEDIGQRRRLVALQVSERPDLGAAACPGG